MVNESKAFSSSLYKKTFILEKPESKFITALLVSATIDVAIIHELFDKRETEKNYKFEFKKTHYAVIDNVYKN
jgi:hypothetical protein